MEQGRLVEEWLLVVVGRPPVAGRGHLAARLRVMGLVGIPEGGGPEAPEEDDEDERGRQKTESGVVRELATRIYRSSAAPGGPHPVRLLHRVTSRDRQAFRHVPGCRLLRDLPSGVKKIGSVRLQADSCRVRLKPDTTNDVRVEELTRSL